MRAPPRRCAARGRSLKRVVCAILVAPALTGSSLSPVSHCTPLLVRVCSSASSQRRARCTRVTRHRAGSRFSRVVARRVRVGSAQYLYHRYITVSPLHTEDTEILTVGRTLLYTVRLKRRAARAIRGTRSGVPSCSQGRATLRGEVHAAAASARTLRSADDDCVALWKQLSLIHI